MPSMKDLLSQRYSLVEAAKAIRDRAKAANRDLTDAELTAIETGLEAAEAVHAEIQKQDPSSPTFRRDVDGAWAVANTSPAVPRSVLGSFRSDPPGYGSPAPRFVHGGSAGGSIAARLFGDCRGQNNGFGSFGDFLQVLDSGRNDPRLNASGMNTGHTSAGGALVPTEYAVAAIDAVLEKTILLQRATLFRMATKDLEIAGWDGHDHSSRSLFGGITAAWSEEAGTLTPQDAKTRKIHLQAKKLAVLTQSSSELLADAAEYERLLGSALIEGLAWEADYQLLRGTGAGRPLGCHNANSTISISAESGQDADSIWFINLCKMMARLHPSCWQNAIWIVHPSCVVPLFRLDAHADYGSGSSLIGDTVYTGFKEDRGDFFLFGKRVFVSEKAAPLGDLGDITLVDPSKLIVGMRQEIEIARSNHVYFASDQVAHRAIMRMDGMPAWASAVTPASGSDSLSWCVILAERA